MHAQHDHPRGWVQPPIGRDGAGVAVSSVKSRRRWTAAVLPPLLAAGGILALAPSAAADIVPGRTIETFIGIDYVAVSGYPADAPVLVEVLRGSQVIGSAQYTTDGNGFFEINHVGGEGATSDCWTSQYTPDIRPEDKVRATLYPDGPSPSEVSTSTVRDVFIDTENVTYTVGTGTNDSSITVTGRAKTSPTAPINPGADVLEARINLGGGQQWSDTGRRDKRADVGATVPPGSGEFTYTFTGLTATDVQNARTSSEIALEWSPAAAAGAGEAEGLPPELSIWDGEEPPPPGCPAHAPADQTAPTTPTNVSAAVAGDGIVRVSWTASTDNVGVTGYVVYDGTAEVGRVTGNPPATSVLIDGVDTAAPHSYSVEAFDAVGNKSQRSAPVGLGTAPARDTEAPTAPVLSGSMDGSTAKLSWTAATDNVGVTGYQVIRDGSKVGNDLPSSTLTFDDPGRQVGVTHAYVVKAVDAAANATASNPVSLTATAPAGDGTAPTVRTKNPGSTVYGVGVSANTVVGFSETVQGVDTSTFTLKHSITGAQVGAAVRFNTSTNKWVLNPVANMTPDTRYVVTLTGGPDAIRDASGTPLATTSWEFTTGPRPRVSQKSPLAGATGVNRTTDVVVTFSENVLASSISTKTVTLKPASGGVIVPAAVTYDSVNKRATLNPTGTLEANKKYVVRLLGGPLTGPTANIQDGAGNPLANTSWSFTTGGS